ncbi:hypothetical protein GJ496_003897 [Pomphorhynchus laevis]|nr:hypothetical protein GJ496_003897 [Pomphorhynchus laevis]
MGSSCQRCRLIIELERPDNVYYSGEVISGNIRFLKCSNHSFLICRSVVLILKCKLIDLDGLCSTNGPISNLAYTSNAQISPSVHVHKFFTNKAIINLDDEFIQHRNNDSGIDDDDSSCMNGYESDVDLAGNISDTNPEHYAEDQIIEKKYKFELNIPQEALPSVNLSDKSKIVYTLKLKHQDIKNAMLFKFPNQNLQITVIPRTGLIEKSLHTAQHTMLLGDGILIEFVLNDCVYTLPANIILYAKIILTAETISASDVDRLLKSSSVHVQITRCIQINKHIIKSIVQQSQFILDEQQDDSQCKAMEKSFCLSSRVIIPSFNAFQHCNANKKLLRSLGPCKDLDIKYFMEISMLPENTDNETNAKGITKFCSIPITFSNILTPFDK